jgi:hypothetical protein
MIIKWYGQTEVTVDQLCDHVGKGWETIIRDLVIDLEKMGWDGYLCDVKEKYGGLRFYIGNGSTEIHYRINEAENLSLKTCENCGQPGERRSIGWIKCLCNNCTHVK